MFKTIFMNIQTHIYIAINVVEETLEQYNNTSELT